MSAELETTECAECGEMFDAEAEGTWIDGIGEVCSHCRHEAGRECALCEERYGEEEEYWSGLVVANHEFAAAGEMWVPGFYLMTGSPYSPAMIGAGTVEGDNLLYAGWGEGLELPEVSGYVCAGCGEVHAGAARLYYGDLRKSLKDDAAEKATEQESHWMRVALGAWPDLLRGHECEPGELEELWGRLGMEAVPTWSEWLLVERKRVRVWRRYQGMDYRDCVLRPEPRYRERWVRGPEMREKDLAFSVSDLATYHGGSWIGVGSNFIHEGEAVRAVVEAIDRGILSQGGIDREANVVEWEVRGAVYRDQYAGVSDCWKEPRAGWPDISTLEKAWVHMLKSYHFRTPKEDDAEGLAALRRGWLKGGQDEA